MKYFFILGNHPTLSLAELSAVLGKNAGWDWPANNVLLADIGEEIDAPALIKRLGGTVKIGRVEKRLPKPTTRNLARKAIELLSPGAGKFNFGFSYYGRRIFNTKPLAMEIKTYLKEQGVSCRWVTSREKTLSSVVVEQNKLTGPGAEIVLIEKNQELIIGRTLAVQPFKDLSYRDYGRPGRDDASGMLPPKLAQIMINLAMPRAETKRVPSLLDPFCGSGTILTEALLLGYNRVIGSDQSKQAIKDTEDNIIWTKEKFALAGFSFDLYARSATELSRFIAPQSIDAIVTEPYLGPQRGKIDFKRVITELENLYGQALSEFAKVLKPDGRVVMVWPVFRASHSPAQPGKNKRLLPNTYCLTPNLLNFKIINCVPAPLQSSKYLELTNRGTCVYGRPGQRVWREVVVLSTNTSA